MSVQLRVTSTVYLTVVFLTIDPLAASAMFLF